MKNQGVDAFVMLWRCSQDEMGAWHCRQCRSYLWLSLVSLKESIIY